VTSGERTRVFQLSIAFDSIKAETTNVAGEGDVDLGRGCIERHQSQLLIRANMTGEPWSITRAMRKSRRREPVQPANAARG
jgi:hypothetical protein